MKADKYKINGEEKYHYGDLPTNSKKDDVDKKEIFARTAENIKKISELQEKFYAWGKEGLIIILQALDAAGKDSTVKHVMSGVNPQGVDVYSFKTPNSEELAHDYLWRVNKCIPSRGKIAIFNRSYYEDVLVVQVHGLNKTYDMAPRVISDSSKEFFEERYRQIRNYEEYLYENSYRVVKIFLNVSKDKQKERFLERIDDPAKNWKFSASDLEERAHWDEYQEVIEDVVNATSTKKCPWYVLPADQKWYTRYLVSEVILDALEDIAPEFPKMPGDEQARLGECRERLVNEEKSGKEKAKADKIDNAENSGKD